MQNRFARPDASDRHKGLLIRRKKMINNRVMSRLLTNPSLLRTGRAGLRRNADDFPALALGPIVERFLVLGGKTF